MQASLNPIAQSTTIAVELIYNIRFPNVLILNRKKQLPAMLVKLRIIAALLTSIGMPNARITWIKYGRQTIAPANSNNRFKQMTKMNGFILRWCCSSLILSKKLAFGWWHFINCWAHETHAVDTILWFWSFINSSCTSSGPTQPRSHCNDFWASFGRCMDSNQLGVSGIWQINWEKIPLVKEIFPKKRRKEEADL